MVAPEFDLIGVIHDVLDIDVTRDDLKGVVPDLPLYWRFAIGQVQALKMRHPKQQIKTIYLSAMMLACRATICQFLSVFIHTLV
jgi:hypothetical protein